MKHKWKRIKDGEIDEWAWDCEFHNGVVCEVCGKIVCVNCCTDWEELDDCSVTLNEGDY